MSGVKGQRGPLTFRCGKCKRGGSCHRPGNRDIGTNWEATGKTKLVGRHRRQQAQYKCLDCGHVGWSNHESVRDANNRLIDRTQKEE